jgi:misacylated tRNA(Ala) deacylase
MRRLSSMKQSLRIGLERRVDLLSRRVHDEPVNVAPTEMLYATDSYLCEFESQVVATDTDTRAVALAATAFFPTGGGQPHDAGTLGGSRAALEVIDVTKDRDGVIWHRLGDGTALPSLGQVLRGALDWDRRYLIMRLHTAQHIMNGIIWRDHRARVTGAQISPPHARLDFELGTMSAEFARQLETAINEVVSENLPVCPRWLPRSEADRDPSLMRLKANLIPRSIDPLRVIDIVGLDRQADGGTHVGTTREVGEVRVIKAESKGRSNKRVRIALSDRGNA